MPSKKLALPAEGIAIRACWWCIRLESNTGTDQIDSEGSFQIKYVNPADDPAERKKVGA